MPLGASSGYRLNRPTKASHAAYLMATSVSEALMYQLDEET
jgi:hypothetical protein